MGGTFATLGIKKNIENIASYGSAPPHLQEKGMASILFCDKEKIRTSLASIEKKGWEKYVCRNQWVVTEDKVIEQENRKGSFQEWYVIGFIWDENTQYFGFISKKELLNKVLVNRNDGLDLEIKMNENIEERFSRTFKNLLDKKIGKIKCLHLGVGMDTKNCRDWQVWGGLITVPLGYIGKEKIIEKTLKEATLVVKPINQIRFSDGKIKIGSKYEWSTKTQLTSKLQLVK